MDRISERFNESCIKILRILQKAKLFDIDVFNKVYETIVVFITDKILFMYYDTKILGKSGLFKYDMYEYILNLFEKEQNILILYDNISTTQIILNNMLDTKYNKHKNHEFNNILSYNLNYDQCKNINVYIENTLLQKCQVLYLDSPSYIDIKFIQSLEEVEKIPIKYIALLYNDVFSLPNIKDIYEYLTNTDNWKEINSFSGINYDRVIDEHYVIIFEKNIDKV